MSMRIWGDRAKARRVLLGRLGIGRASAHIGRVPWQPGTPHWTPLSRALDAVGDRWTLVILGELLTGPLRAGELVARMPGMAPTSLKRHLQEMVAQGLVFRRTRELLPRIEYGLTESGHELLGVLEQLARWGMRRAWSAPGSHEHVQIDMLIRQLPLLLDRSQLPSGVIELVVEGSDQPQRHMMSIDRGKVAILEEELHTVMPWARIMGAEQAWIRALGPECAHDGLTITGDRGLAGSLLDALPRHG